MQHQKGEEVPKTSSAEISKSAPVDLFFNTDSSQLPEASYAELKELAKWGKCNPNGAILLEGYADPTGTVDHNTKLSNARATAVKNKLIAMGVPEERIEVRIFGELGTRRATYAEDRRVTAKAETKAVSEEDLRG